MSSRYNEKSDEEKALIRKKISESQKARLAKRSKAEIELKAQKQRTYMNNRTPEQKQKALEKALETRSKKSVDEIKAIYSKQSKTCKETWKNKSIEEKERISKLHKDIYNSFSSEKLNEIANKKRQAWKNLLENMTDSELEEFTQVRKQGFKNYWNNLSEIEKQKWREEAAVNGRKGFEAYINKIGLAVHKNKCKQGYYNLSKTKRHEICNKISKHYLSLSNKEKENYKQVRILHGWKSFDIDKQNRIINKIHYIKKQNNSYGKSTLENNIYTLLSKEYFNLERQYNYENYTFDFKLSFENKYTLIDIHGAYYHNYRPYSGTISDLQEFELLKKGRTSSIIADTWRYRDTERYNICKKNNISYIRIYIKGNVNEQDYVNICNNIKENLFNGLVTLYYNK